MGDQGHPSRDRAAGHRLISGSISRSEERPLREFHARPERPEFPNNRRVIGNFHELIKVVGKYILYLPAQPKVLEFSHHLQKVNFLKNTCSAKLIVNFLFNTQPRYVIHAPLDFLRVISIDIMDIITCNAWNQHPSLFTPLPAGASLN